MKKIGVMTFHRSHNNGSMLQAYALQTILREKYLLDAEIINFSNKAQREIYSLYNKKASLKNSLKNGLIKMNQRVLQQHFNDFEKFIDEAFVLSPNDLMTHDDLEKHATGYELLVAGSDQIWNISCLDADDAYFLTFNQQAKKIGYACSLGAVNLLTHSHNPANYRRYLASFSAISSREGNGQKWLSQLTTQEIGITLDPTLLLSKEEWYELIDDSPLIEGPYIFYYAFHYPSYISKEVKALSDKLGIPVVMIDGKSWAVKGLKRFAFKLTEHGGPRVFLNMMKYAELVVTTSFHGTIFATLFEKNFCFIDSKLKNENDDRATFLMAQLGVSDRLVQLNHLLATDFYKTSDRQTISCNLERLKLHSFDFIEREIVGG